MLSCQICGDAGLRVSFTMLPAVPFPLLPPLVELDPSRFPFPGWGLLVSVLTCVVVTAASVLPDHAALQRLWRLQALPVQASLNTAHLMA